MLKFNIKNASIRISDALNKEGIYSKIKDSVIFIDCTNLELAVSAILENAEILNVQESDEIEQLIGCVPFDRYLAYLLKGALSQLDKRKELEVQLDVFLEEIDFPSPIDDDVKEVFITACRIRKEEKICYKSLFGKIAKKHPIREDFVKKTLMTSFKFWLNDKYPDLKSYYPNSSVMDLIKIFADALR